MITVSDQLESLPPATRGIVEAAVRAVRAAAPQAEEIPYQMRAPRSDRMMWKLVRYAVDGANVVGVGTFTHHASLFFYRGRELDQGDGILQGSGKDTRFVTLRSPDDARSPAVKELLREAFALAAG
jgi:uncharacterized protein DUF1801